MRARGSLQSARLSGANISPCNRYRFRLWRFWGNRSNLALFIMLNPSTADALLDDPTIRRCIGFARAWEHGGVEVVNLFAWRVTHPDLLEPARRAGNDIVGPQNDEVILAAARRARRVIVAWGAHAAARERGPRALVALVRAAIPMHHLGLNGDGSPKHPLYLSKATTPEPFRVRT